MPFLAINNNIIDIKGKHAAIDGWKLYISDEIIFTDTTYTTYHNTNSIMFNTQRRLWNILLWNELIAFKEIGHVISNIKNNPATEYSWCPSLSNHRLNICLPTPISFGSKLPIGRHKHTIVSKKEINRNTVCLRCNIFVVNSGYPLTDHDNICFRQ